MKLKAFTLAEVLIALVVLGVIAAMTIPNITEGTRKSEYSARLKKFYATLNQAQTRAYAFGNYWDIWCQETGKEYDSSTKTTKEFAETYLVPHVSVLRKGVVNGKYTIYLNDGTSFYLTKEQCLHFFFDANGDKKPNVSGRDQYRYTFCPSTIDRSLIDAQPGVLIAYPWKTGKTRKEALNACKSNPDTCSKLLLIDEWDYKNDYPYAI